MSAQPPPPPPPPPAGPPAPVQPLYTPPPYIPASQLRPSQAWYWVAGAVGVLAVGLSVVLFISFFSSLVDELTGPLTHLRAPGQVSLELEAGAERTIYRQERESGSPVRGGSGPDPRCTVTGADGGRVEVGDSFEWTLTRSGDTYEAMYDFTAAQSGTYRVACEASDRVRGPVPLAIGESIGLWDLFKKAGAALAVFFGGLIAAAVIAIVTAVMRDNHKKRLQREALERGGQTPPTQPPAPPAA
jgi:hypothetical protein